MSTTIYRHMPDEYLGNGETIECIRIEGAGDVPPGAFQVEHFEGDEWTAWYRPEDAPSI